MADEKKYISRIQLTDGSTVDVKDKEARLELESLFTDTLILDCGTSIEVIDDINPKSTQS